jgi:origin recognition complex subunit 5
MSDDETPTDLLTTLNDEFPCRAPQLHCLAALIGTDDSPSPPTIVLHGLAATGKTLILRSFLERAQASFTWIACHECITSRQLCERIAAGVSANVGSSSSSSSNNNASYKAENPSSLAVHLSTVLKGVERKHFLVLDRADRQREASVLPALARLGEVVPGLSVLFVISVTRPGSLNCGGEVPHVAFTPYTKEESIRVLAKYVRRIGHGDDDGDGGEEGERTEEDAKEESYVWQKFCGTVWDSLAKGTARIVVQFRAIVDEMWEPFVEPIAEGRYGTRNYSSLYLLQKDVFKRETNVVDSVLPRGGSNGGGGGGGRVHDLPYYSKFLLCAAYLASYNPQRQDALFFMKAGDHKKKRRGGGARGGGGKRQSKNRKIHRRLLGPQAFSLERLQAIFLAILPRKTPSCTSVDVQMQVATLTSLRLMVKAGGAAAAGGDVLDAGAKWRVNVGWEYVRGVAKSVRFDVEDFVAE